MLYPVTCHDTWIATNLEAVNLAKFTVIKVGKALSVDDLTKKPAPRGRKPNPRDEDLAKLVNEVSVGPESQVIPWEFEGKIATARLAASRAIKSMDAHVFVSSRLDYPGQLLFSRVPLSGRQGRRDLPAASQGAGRSLG